MTDVDPLRTDRDKVRAMVDEWLAEQPAIAQLFRGSIGEPDGWRIRADLEADGWVWISLRSPAGATIAVWHGPRAQIEQSASASETVQ